MHLREALVAVGVEAEVLDATAAQLSGAMNEAALWVLEQPDREASLAAAHAVLDRWIDGSMRWWRSSGW